MLESTYALVHLSYLKSVQWWNHPTEIKSIARHREPTPLLSQLYSFLFDPPTLIADNIYLGNAFNASCQSVLADCEIGAILNVSYEIPCFFPKEYKYLWLSVSDTKGSNLLPYFQKGYEFIKEAQAAHPEKKIFIHCYAGASRSAAITAFYLMQEKNWSLTETLEFLERKRPIVNINQEFIDQLQISS